MTELFHTKSQEDIPLNKHSFHRVAGELSGKIQEAQRNPNSLKDFLFGSVPSFHDRSLGYANLSIKDDGKTYTYRTAPVSSLAASDIPTIAVHDLPRFADGLTQLAGTMRQKRHLPWVYRDIFWEESANLRKIWYNATPYDFAHPEQFVEKVAGFLRDETFLDMMQYQNFGMLFTLQHQLLARTSIEANVYETPYAFDFHLVPTNAHAIPNNVGQLPLVRYGISRGTQGQQVATIYAVQNPLQSSSLSTEEQAIGQGLDTETVLVEQERKKLMRKLYKVDANDPPFDQEDPDDKDLLNASRPAIISLLASCVLLKDRGISTIQIPTFLPLRWQDHIQKDGREKAAEFQYRATDSLIRLIDRVARQVSGVVLDIPNDEEQEAYASYLTVHLPKDVPLTASNPILQEVIALCLR